MHDAATEPRIAYTAIEFPICVHAALSNQQICTHMIYIMSIVLIDINKKKKQQNKMLMFFRFE